MAWRDHLGKVGGSLMGAGLVLGVGYLITSHAVGQPSPHLTWPVWPYYLCAGMLAVGAFLYGTAHEMLPWQTHRALKRRAEAAESAVKDVRADLEKVQTERDEARRELADAQRAAIPPPPADGPTPQLLVPRYEQREPYRQPDEHDSQIEYRVGIQNPPGNPPVNGVRLEWTAISPQPQTEANLPSIYPPQPVPGLTTGDPGTGITLLPGREDFWVIATAIAAAGPDGAIRVGLFSRDSVGGHFRGLIWLFRPGRPWHLSYRIVAENLPSAEFGLVMTAVDGKIRCDLEPSARLLARIAVAGRRSPLPVERHAEGAP